MSENVRKCPTAAESLLMIAQTANALTFRFGGSSMPESIDGDGDDDDHAGDDLLHPVWPGKLSAAGSDGGHDGGADERAEGRAFTAGEASAADHDGGDDVEFQPR